MNNSQQQMSQSGSKFNQGQSYGEGDENIKSRKKREAKIEINRAVDEAHSLIIQGEYTNANRLVYDTMTRCIGNGCFEEQSIELLPAFFALATANICIGGPRLKKAENFLVSAFWNLLKSTSDESEKRSDDDLVSEADIERFKAGLHKTFGRFFLAKNEPEAFNNALEHLTKGIYLECNEFGPESYRMCSSYFYMGELFKKENQLQKAKAFYAKIIQIWRKFILDNDFDQMQDYQVTCIEPIYYHEAEQHLRQITTFFEMEFGQHYIITAESTFTLGLIYLKIGLDMQGYESIKNAHAIFANNLGEFDDRTKEVEDVLFKVDTRFKMQQQE